ncbi:unnamed protein product [Moneuplotes crassus]|uniref:Uncharacterized protein n=1 Tax=Euplotes crassus TaxID=5936 RepID=A0AAD1XD37_EUPCR|nr:unnamed protein product [Moneuplotes crassus]
MLKTTETTNICNNSKTINEARKALYDAVLLDAGLYKANSTKQVDEDLTEKNVFIDSFNSFEIVQNLTINVGIRTGKPAAGVDLKLINSKERFKTRVDAFSFLSKYWLPINRSKKLPEVAKRSLSPLKIIFDFQEEEIFEIPPERNSRNIQIEIGQFDESPLKKVQRKRRVKRTSRKTSANCNQSKIIKGLSSILSELESQDDTKVSDYCDITSLRSTNSRKTTSKGRKSGTRTKASISSKSIASNAGLLKPSVRKVRVKKNRISSMSYGKICLSTIVKSLDEISSEL